MAIDRKLLDILCCPVTGQPLQPLGKDQLKQLNELIGKGQVRSYDNSPVTEPLREALVTGNGERIYPIDDGIPVMLSDKAISAHVLRAG